MLENINAAVSGLGMKFIVILLSIGYMVTDSQGTSCNGSSIDDIRLVEGDGYQGLVEICTRHGWTSICGSRWSNAEARLACRLLGLPHMNATATTGGGCTTFNENTVNGCRELTDCNDTGRMESCMSSDRTGIHPAAGVVCSSPCEPEQCTNTTYCLPPSSTCSCPTPVNDCTCLEDVCDLPCSNGGNCIGPDTCHCPDNWNGTYCEQPLCDPPCSNGGNCTGPDTCQCPDNWNGAYCEQPTCNPPCDRREICTAPNKCQCMDGTNCSKQDNVAIVVAAVVVVVILIAAGICLGLAYMWKRKTSQRKTCGITEITKRRSKDNITYEGIELPTQDEASDINGNSATAVQNSAATENEIFYDSPDALNRICCSEKGNIKTGIFANSDSRNPIPKSEMPVGREPEHTYDEVFAQTCHAKEHPEKHSEELKYEYAAVNSGNLLAKKFTGVYSVLTSEESQIDKPENSTTYDVILANSEQSMEENNSLGEMSDRKSVHEYSKLNHPHFTKSETASSQHVKERPQNIEYEETNTFDKWVKSQQHEEDWLSDEEVNSQKEPLFQQNDSSLDFESKPSHLGDNSHEQQGIEIIENLDSATRKDDTTLEHKEKIPNESKERDSTILHSHLKHL